MVLPAVSTARLLVPPSRPSAPPAVPGGALRRFAGALLPVAIGCLAFALRLAVMLRGGGLTQIGGYDDGVYYAAGDALVHGRLPYQDFLFLHPPGILLVTAPFAALGAVTNDVTGFVDARLAFELIGGLDAALIVLILRRFGGAAPLVGGVLYAVLQPAIWADRSVLLEPIGNLGVLVALLLLQRGASSWRVVVAGLAAGSAADVKIWYVVPVVVLAFAGTRHPLRFLLGALAAVAVVWVPFLVAAPAAMIREVVLDQVGRPHRTALLKRLAGMLDAQPAGSFDLRAVTSALAVLAVLAVGIALLTRGARVLGVLLAADAAVLLTAPTYFEHYGAFSAPPLALCAGIAVQRTAGRLPLRRWTGPAVAVAAAGAVLVAGLHVDDRVRSGVLVPAAFTEAVARAKGCIASDDPTMLVVGDVLSRDLAHARCEVWPDVSGWTYDAADRRTASGTEVSRPRNAAWQHLVLGYLRSGSATVVVRRGTGLSRHSRAVLDAHKPLVRVGHYVLRPTPHHHPHVRHHHRRRAPRRAV